MKDEHWGIKAGSFMTIKLLGLIIVFPSKPLQSKKHYTIYKPI